ncbi:MAG TPA: hypothetical protein VJY35_15520 [Candidatus Eisenbacteria bacterium]|nr:hypothetical protein [Candidatus Eisenbacteria bacterium]
MSRLVQDLSSRGVPVTDHAIYMWVAGRRAPRVPAATAMVELSGGTLTFDDIYRHSKLVTNGS